MNKPLVSVVIPFYSGVAWLEEALESVLSQSYNHFEVIVINDGSNQNISTLVEKYSKEVNFFNKGNEGPASARNLGIHLSKGKYIAFLDSDDVWVPKKLEKQITYMENNNYVWSHHSYEMFWEDKDKVKVIHAEKLKGNVLKDTYISFKAQTSCIVVRKDSLEINEIIFPMNKRYGQDMVFFRELAKLYPLGHIEDVLSKFRIRGSNAGFRAKVQLADRADTWDDIKTDKKILNILPTNVILAYKIAWVLNLLFKKSDGKIINNDYFSEILAKVLYLIPYILLKINNKK